MPSLHELPGLLPALPGRLLHGHDGGNYDNVEIYTDGSYAVREEALATWAFIVYGRPEGHDHIHLIDWYGDFITVDPLDTQWVGALRQHIREADTTALIWTALYLLADHKGLHAAIYSDALAVLNAATGKWATKPDEHIGVRFRASFQLPHRVKRSPELQCRHVKSHSGVLGNELVDAIANAIRTASLPCRPPPRHYAGWMQGDPPKIRRSHMLVDAYFKPELPQLEGDCWTWTNAEIPATPANWLQDGTPI